MSPLCCALNPLYNTHTRSLNAFNTITIYDEVIRIYKEGRGFEAALDTNSRWRLSSISLKFVWIRSAAKSKCRATLAHRVRVNTAKRNAREKWEQKTAKLICGIDAMWVNCRNTHERKKNSNSKLLSAFPLVLHIVCTKTKFFIFVIHP